MMAKHSDSWYRPKGFPLQQLVEFLATPLLLWSAQYPKRKIKMRLPIFYSRGSRHTAVMSGGEQKVSRKSRIFFKRGITRINCVMNSSPNRGSQQRSWKHLCPPSQSSMSDRIRVAFVNWLTGFAISWLLGIPDWIWRPTACTPYAIPEEAIKPGLSNLNTDLARKMKCWSVVPLTQARIIFGVKDCKYHLKLICGSRWLQHCQFRCWRTGTGLLIMDGRYLWNLYLLDWQILLGFWEACLYGSEHQIYFFSSSIPIT